jgi:hypothetical protein
MRINQNDVYYKRSITSIQNYVCCVWQKTTYYTLKVHLLTCKMKNIMNSKEHWWTTKSTTNVILNWSYWPFIVYIVLVNSHLFGCPQMDFREYAFVLFCQQNVMVNWIIWRNAIYVYLYHWNNLKRLWISLIIRYVTLTSVTAKFRNNHPFLIEKKYREVRDCSINVYNLAHFMFEKFRSIR